MPGGLRARLDYCGWSNYTQQGPPHGLSPCTGARWRSFICDAYYHLIAIIPFIKRGRGQKWL